MSSLAFAIIAVRTSLSVDASHDPEGHFISVRSANCYFPSLHVQSDDSASSLYDKVAARCPHVQLSKDVSIIVNGKIILNLVDDPRTIQDIGITEESSSIQVIEKPIFVALLEMVADIDNIESIPWFNQATQYLSDPSAQMMESFVGWLIYSKTEDVIGIDLSHLNLTGTVHLGALPNSVRTLDLSFNDLLTVDLSELKSESLERLNIEHNDKLQVNVEHRISVPEHSRCSRTLQLSSNQIFKSIKDLNTKHFRIENWLYRQSVFDVLVFDGKTINRKTTPPFYVAMLNVVEGVTNKHVIPWYKSFVDEISLEPEEWLNCRVVHISGSNRKRRGLVFDLSGLGLQGHIDLASLPRLVMKVDLSNNNLSSISLPGEGPYKLRELNIQNNIHLRFDLDELRKSALLLSHLNRFLISSNQLVSNGSIVSLSTVQQRFEGRNLNQIVLDDLEIELTRVLKSRWF